jgi:hypothetical protein
MKKLYSLFAVIALAASVSAQTYQTGFETITKGGYGAGTEVFDGYEWQLDGILAGNVASDFKIGTKSLRIAGNLKSTSAAGLTAVKAEMNTPKPNGIGQIQFQYAIYGTDAQITWNVEYFNGTAWVGIGSITGTATPQTTTYTVNNSTATKVRIISGAGLDLNATTNGKRLNVDEFKISDYNVTLGVSDIKNLNANFVKSTLVNDEVKFGTKSEVKVYNMNGQLIKTAQVSETKSLDASDLQSGMYIITGTLDRKPVSQKIIKK